MPPKYSHVKKRSAAGLLKPGASTPSNLIKESYDPNNPQGSSNQQGHQYHHHIQLNTNHFPILGVQPGSVLPNIDRGLSQAMTAVAHLERAIARILLLRFEWDIARLYSTRLHWVSLLHIPILVAKLAEKAGPSWPAMNADSEEIKDFFRAVVGMDMREAGERVATKSVLWSYTVLRRFALAHSVPVCGQRGLHSLRLLPHYTDLKDHLDSLEEKPTPIFEKPSFFGGLESGFRLLEETCVSMGMDLGIETGRNYDPTIPYLDEHGNYLGEGLLGGSGAGATSSSAGPAIPPSMEARIKLRLGYIKMVQTLWRVAREFDVCGYGQVLREKLTIKWCECGCSTEHLGEVCERTVREEEEDRERDGHGIWGGGELTMAAYAPIVSQPPLPAPPAVKGKGGKKKGVVPTNGPKPIDAEERDRIYARLKVIKEKEWDGRGSGVYGWENEREEDIWEVELDFGAGKSNRGRTKKTGEIPPVSTESSPSPNSQPNGKANKKEKPLKLTVKTAGGTVTLEEVADDVEVKLNGSKANGKGKQKAKAAIVEEVKPEPQPQPEPVQPEKAKELDSYAEEEAQMTIGEMMEWRFIKAEAEKELGNNAFRNGYFEEAVKHYTSAYQMEPEMPHYQLNLAAAYLKLNNWMEAENACTKALIQHRSSKGLFRRAKARKMLEKYDDAIKDYRALIRLQPHNTAAMVDLLLLLYPPSTDRPPDTPEGYKSAWGVNLKPETEEEISALYDKLGIARPKRQKALPFERTKADDVKLKIVAIPPTNPAAEKFDKVDWGDEGSGGGDESVNGTKGKLKSGKLRGKEKRDAGGGSGIIRGTAADYGVVLLAWDRYLVLQED
ncbi:hypothetical protein FA15DRAFT_273893 [Coprinopsis marcescibilis]|uniref:Uncharacterized protein n=1 Tax=Coprinopsis marcescibilis TaxID=230819 RepID=A0A5C3KDJ3_COPMA|nr:hypothetical protein FA15DRAFT_273893 [Coprinopsis marcescibilis]